MPGSGAGGELLVKFEVAAGHGVAGEFFDRDVAAFGGIDLAGGFDGVGEFGGRVHENSGSAMIDNRGQCAAAKGDDGGSAGERLHGDEGTGFADRAGNDDATRRGEQAMFAGAADGADEAALFGEAWDDFVFEIILVRFVFERFAGENQRQVEF